VHVALADKNRAGGAQAARHFGVLAVAMLPASVLLPAVVRTPAASILSLRPMGMPCSGPRRRLFLFERFCLRERLFAHHRDPRVGLGIEGVDAVEAGLREFDRRDFARAEIVGCLPEGPHTGSAEFCMWVYLWAYRRSARTPLWTGPAPWYRSAGRAALMPVGRLLVSVRQREHVDSEKSGPAICSPIGRPSFEKPQGMEITGRP
jgi:hypothetical protein